MSENISGRKIIDNQIEILITRISNMNINYPIHDGSSEGLIRTQQMLLELLKFRIDNY